MADIFLSYASEDRDRVRSLVETLEAEGWSIWWDPEIHAGRRFDKVIEEQVNKASCVVVAWSEASVKSDWVRDEANEGRERQILAPLRLDDVRPPMGFRSAQTANLIGWPESKGEIETLIAGIRDLIAPASAAETGPSDTQKSIAVLPFANMSSDPEQEYFSDGISEDILNGLVKFRNLEVIARTSSFQFKGENRDIRDIGKQLNVNHILEGSVRKAGNRIRVTAQLNLTSDGSHVWSDQYDRELTNVFEVQDDIAGAVLRALKVHLTGSDKEQIRTANMAAYNAYLLGRHQLNRGELDRAVVSFEKAISLDADYADTYGMLASAHNQYIWWGLDPVRAKLPEIHHYIDKALSLSSNQTEALIAKECIRFFVDGAYQVAISELSDLARKYPNNTDLLHIYGCFFQTIGRYDLAFTILNRLVELDPLSPVAHNARGVIYQNAGRLAEARQSFTKMAVGD